MRGHIRKRGDTYTVVVELPRHPLTKKRRQLWKSGFRTKREAESALTTLLRQQDTGMPIEPIKLTLAAHLSAWVAKRLAAGTIRKSTAEEHRYGINGRIAATIGGYALPALTPAHLDAWLGELRKEGLGEQRIRALYNLVNGGYRAAVKLRMVAYNPCDGVDTPQSRPKERVIWDEVQVARFRDRIRGDALEPLYLLALGTGLRKGEILGLRWSDVDLARGTLTVARQQTYTLGGVGYDDPKTRQGLRSMSLPRFVLAALAGLRAVTPGDGAIFRLGDQPLTAHRLEYRWQRLRATFPPELPAITFHDLRHIHATIALGAGVDAKVISQRLGHSSVRFTMDRYAHVTKARDADAADKIDDAFAAD